MSRGLSTIGAPLFGGRDPLLFLAQMRAKYGGVTWPFQEPSGATADAKNEALALGRDMVINGDFATDTIWTKGAGWTIAAGVANCDGSQGGNTDLKQNLSAVTQAAATYEITYTVTGYSAGTHKGIVGSIPSAAETGNGTFTKQIVAAGGAIFGIRGDSALICKVDDVSIKRVNIPADDPNMDAAHTGATVGQATGVPGLLGVSYDGANDYSAAHSPELNSMFNPDAGTLLAAAKVSGAGVWEDGQFRRFAIMSADSNNLIFADKSSTNNRLRVGYLAGGVTTKLRNIDGLTTTDMFLLGLTWNTVTDVAVGYYNGVKQGANITGLGTWVGNFDSALATVGAGSTVPVQVQDGLVTIPTLLRGAMTEAEVAHLAQLLGVA